MTSLSLSPRQCWQWLAYHHQAAEGSLYLMFFSGLLLVVHGTPGDSLGNLASWAHWLSALALTPLVLRHAWRWTILKWRT